MKKLQKIFDKSLKSYADTREFDFKKAVYDSIEEKDYNREDHLKEYKREMKARASYLKSAMESIINYGPDDNSLREIKHDLSHLVGMLEDKKMWKEVNWR